VFGSHGFKMLRLRILGFGEIWIYSVGVFNNCSDDSLWRGEQESCQEADAIGAGWVSGIWADGVLGRGALMEFINKDFVSWFSFLALDFSMFSEF
jgi:hypothetical protein